MMTKRRAPLLDGRLSAAMALAENMHIFADIGADHGRLSTVLLLQDEARRGLVADISPLALDKARTRIERMGLADRAIFAVADGLDALDALLPEYADTIFVLGMGGDTVSNILLGGAPKLHGAALILGAQTEIPLVRRALLSIGYRIRREVIASENGRDYLLIRATPAQQGEAAYTEEEILLGPVLLKELPQSWLSVLKRRQRLLDQGIRAMQATALVKDADRLALFKREMGYVKQALAQLGKDEQP